MGGWGGENGRRVPLLYTVISKDEQADRSTGGKPNKNQNKQQQNKKEEREREIDLSLIHI